MCHASVMSIALILLWADRRQALGGMHRHAVAQGPCSYLEGQLEVGVLAALPDCVHWTVLIIRG